MCCAMQERAGTTEMQLVSLLPLLPSAIKSSYGKGFNGGLGAVRNDFLKFHLALRHTILIPQSDAVGPSRYVNLKTTFCRFKYELVLEYIDTPTKVSSTAMSGAAAFVFDLISGVISI